MKALWLMASCLICATPLAASAAEAEINPDTNTARTSADSNPAVAAAHAISTITGVAISPLLGVSAVGAWKYFRTPSAQRAQLPWFAQPYFWGPALALIVAVFIKDALGTAMPTVLKKPFDVLEVFENKLSALIAAGAFVPLVASIFHSVSSGDSSAVAGMRLAMIDFWPLLNAVAVSVAVLIFLIVWMVAHVINVLIVLSPWGIVDAGLKLARLFVLYTLTAAAFLNVYLGAALSILIILICCFLVGWAFRMTVFGAIF